LRRHNATVAAGPAPGPAPGLPGRKRQPGRQGPDPAALTGQSRTPGGTGAARGGWRGPAGAGEAAAPRGSTPRGKHPRGQATGMMPARRETSLLKSRTRATVMSLREVARAGEAAPGGTGAPLSRTGVLPGRT